MAGRWELPGHDWQANRGAQRAASDLQSAELFSALLTMAAVYVAVELGTTGLVLFGVVLIIFQYLVGELLKSKARGEQLHRVATTDELTGLAAKTVPSTQPSCKDLRQNCSKSAPECCFCQ